MGHRAQHSAMVITGLLLVMSAPVLALRIYFIGNSLTDCVRYDGFRKMAESRGYRQPWGRHMIPGANPTWIWEHPNDGISEPPYGLYPNALSNYEWDVMTLQPTDNLRLDSTACNKFIDLALRRSPNIQVYIFAQHPYLERIDCLPNPSDGLNYDKHWLTPLAVFQQRCGGYAKGTKEYQDTLTWELRRQQGRAEKPVCLIPSGNAIYLLSQWMQHDSYPEHRTLVQLGFTNANQFYSDAAHLNGIGCYVEACAFFATIYKEDPTGLPVPSDYGTIDPRLAAIIQKAVWQTVTTHPLSGVSGTGTVVGFPLRVHLPRHSGSADRLAVWELLIGAHRHGVVMMLDGRQGECAHSQQQKALKAFVQTANR